MTTAHAHLEGPPAPPVQTGTAAGRTASADGVRVIRVIRIIARLNIGGPARHAAVLDHGLRERGYDTLLVYGSVGAHEASLEHLVADRGLPARKIPELGRRLRPFDDLRVLFQLFRLIRRIQPDVVHTHTAKAGALGRIAAAAANLAMPAGRRCVVFHTFHGHVLTGYFGPLGSLCVRACERGLALLSDRIVAISQLQRDDLTTRFRIAPKSKVTVVPLGLELESLLRLSAAGESLRRDLAFNPDAVVFGFVGRFVPIKDIQTLVAAFALARREVPSIRLMLVGDGELRSRLELQVLELGIADAVRFIGWFQDLDRVYRTIDVLVLTSLNEGTPVALIEAMAAGRAVIATRVGGTPDVVRDGETGLLVPAGQPERVAKAMVQLARDSELRSQLGTSARDDVEGRFSTHRLVGEMDALYREHVGRLRSSIAANAAIPTTPVGPPLP